MVVVVDPPGQNQVQHQWCVKLVSPYAKTPYNILALVAIITNGDEWPQKRRGRMHCSRYMIRLDKPVLIGPISRAIDN